MHREVSAKELKNRTGAALRAVAAGEKVLVTRRGRPVAWIIPVQQHDEGAAVRPFDDAWAGIEAALAATAPRFETWQEAERVSRREP